MGDTTVIRAGTLIDGAGHPPLARPVVVIEGGRIQDLGLAGQVQEPVGPEVQVLDEPGLCLLPGLIDAHVHLVFSGSDNPLEDLLKEDDSALLLRAARNAQIALAAGVTTVRDAGGKDTLVISLRNAIDAGIMAGPRIVASGAPITTTGGHCYWLGLEADSADEVRKAARAMSRAGADYFKVMATGGGMTQGTNSRTPQYSEEQLRALVEEGRRLGKKVAAHVHATAAIRYAAAAGIDTLEHCTWMAPGDGLEFDERAVETMARKGIFIDPNPVSSYLRSQRGGRDLTPDRRRMLALRQETLALQRKTIEAGVRVLAGTDAGVTFTRTDAVALNVRLLSEELGLSPLAAIQAATGHSAEALGLAGEVGVLAAGQRADLILVEGNPLTDLGALQRVRWVLRDGQVVARDGHLVLPA